MSKAVTAEVAVRDEGTVEPEVADAGVVEDAPVLWGHVIIEWPETDPRPGGPRPLIGWKCSLFNADTGKRFYTCRKIEVHADVEHLVTADLTMFADEDGKPVFDGEPVLAQDGDGGQVFLEGTFSFLVTGMRTRGTASEVTGG